MKTSVIRHRVADFLKHYAPFDALPEPDLLLLAGSGRVRFHESEEFIYQAGQARQPHVWIIQQGRVELVDEASNLRDVLGEGDLLGLDRFSGNGSYASAARTATDVILYSLDATVFEDVVSRYPAVGHYLAAHFSVERAAAAERTSWLDVELPPHEFLLARTPEAAGGDPPLCLPSRSTRDVVRAMLRNGTASVALTCNGGPPAILTASDLALFCGKNPALLFSEISKAHSAAELAPLVNLAGRMVLDALVHPSDLDDCAFMGAEMASAIAAACIRLADADVVAAGLDAPLVPACWLAFGSLARGENLRPSLPNLAVVYDDTHPACTPFTGAYFAAVAGQTASWFHNCGVEGAETVWPQGTHPCMPISEWQRFYSETIRNPLSSDLYARRELFDIRPLAGDHTIAGRVHAHTKSELEQADLMIALLANDTFANLPPLTFFRGLVVDLEGQQSTSFDLYATAVRPIADAARVFTLGKHGIACTGTLDRLEAAAADRPEHATVFREAAQAFRIALYHTAVTGKSLIEPGQLGRYEQRLLKTAFSSIQRLLELAQVVYCGA